PLREVVEQLAFVYLKSSHPLVLDLSALREAGLEPDTPLAVPAPAADQDAPPPWQALGLEAVAGRSAVLLTTRRQLELWKPAGDGALSEGVEQALAEAVAGGHDPSARFRSALDWLGPVREGAARTADPESSSPLSPGPALDGWTEWEPLAGAPDDASLI